MDIQLEQLKEASRLAWQLKKEAVDAEQLALSVAHAARVADAQEIIGRLLPNGVLPYVVGVDDLSHPADDYTHEYRVQLPEANEIEFLAAVAGHGEFALVEYSSYVLSSHRDMLFRVADKNVWKYKNEKLVLEPVYSKEVFFSDFNTAFGAAMDLWRDGMESRAEQKAHMIAHSSAVPQRAPKPSPLERIVDALEDIRFTLEESRPA